MICPMCNKREADSDDSGDSTYCDIYAKIDPETLKNIDLNEED